MTTTFEFPTVTLPSGATVLAKPDGTPYHYANRTQAQHRERLHQAEHPDYPAVARQFRCGSGPFYVILEA